MPVTGRPAGWCDHIARMWPVDAVVGENGAFYFRYAHQHRRLEKRFLYDEMTRAANCMRLAAVRDRILAEVPGCALASDQPYRETDLAIDFCEDVPPLPLQDAEQIAALMRSAGMTAKVSSIHVNGWFGDYDKLGMTKILARECLGVDLDAERAQFAFAGDSPNDAPMFDFFSYSIGVANVRRFDGLLAARPPTSPRPKPAPDSPKSSPACWETERGTLVGLPADRRSDRFHGRNARHRRRHAARANAPLRVRPAGRRKPGFRRTI